MTSEPSKFAVPESLLATGPLLRFDFSFVDRTIEKLGSNGRFIEAIVTTHKELKALHEAGEIKGDSATTDEAIKFLEQEAIAAMIAFNSKNGIIRL